MTIRNRSWIVYSQRTSFPTNIQCTQRNFHPICTIHLLTSNHLFSQTQLSSSPLIYILMQQNFSCATVTTIAQLPRIIQTSLVTECWNGMMWARPNLSLSISFYCGRKKKQFKPSLLAQDTNAALIPTRITLK